ncbi:putative tail fiber [uncultured Mediterranean phage uvMED]|nr:putative tail fiber [uncultured Mediterranean phage uvMED]
MAKATVNVGTSGNDGTGDPIRTAFQSLNANHTELYSLLGNGTTLSVTGDVAISSGAATIQAGSVENSMLADNAVDHDELANRFANKVDKTDTGSFAVDCSAGSVFLCTGNIATSTITFNNMKQNQVVDLVLSGTLSSAAITFAGGTGLGTTTFNKVGTTNLSTSATNHISLICVKESDGSSIVNYTVNTYASDSNPD